MLLDADALTAISTQDALSLIRTLPQDQAEAVLLRAVMGLDAKSAGRVLGKRAGAVRTAAYRGLRTLAERLAGTAEANGAAPPDAPADRPRATDSDIFRALIAEELS